MDKEQITESTPTVCKFFRAAAVPILVFLVIYGFFLLSGLRLCPNTTGSMAPTIPAYSLCLIDTHVDYDSLQVGDIIVYDRPYDHMQVVHRIIAIFDEGVLTKGDANPVDDGILLTEADITGVYLCHIPGAGLAANLIRTPVGIVVILAIVVLLLVSDARPQKRSKDGNNTPNSQ
ncbi:signal peptidase I [Flavonifractor plautii]|uniref:signal peptidase I n=1 Tax=Flavonifractor TaxID=946234 RepID=UPI000B3AB91A|nr:MULTISPECIES: signal peptidase I [Flavonifractor]MBM6665956.1 signal peptidase I [Flavonifractor plautii]OUQ55552.1 signal peptidase I [Flavonifractor sp. An112]